jgi:V8-like Glu-specific endopeptidase
MMRLLFLCVAVSFAFLQPTAGFSRSLDSKVIYGSDDRRDFYEVEGEMIRESSRYSAAMVERKQLLPVGDRHFQIQFETVGKVFQLCPSEPVFNEPSFAQCSGVLVAPDVVATAGHCLRLQSECDETAFVFNQYVSGPKQPWNGEVAKADVYYCKRVISAEVGKRVDYAFLQLDRPADFFRPEDPPAPALAPVSPSASGKGDDSETVKGDPLFMIGYPLGQPMKLTVNGVVRKAQKQTLLTNLDAFYINSGSPVYNGRTGRLAGLLIQGEIDFNPTPEGCSVTNVCPSGGCGGETVVRMEVIRKHLDRALAKP